MKRKKLAACLCVAVLASISLICAAIALAENQFHLDVSIRGESAVTVQYGTDYQDPGAIAAFYGTKLFQKGISSEIDIRTEGEVDTSSPGTYRITYSAQFAGLEATAERTVTVVDLIPPTILLEKGGLWEPDGKKYSEPGYSAADNCDGDLTAQVIRLEQTDRIIYQVTDSSGNICTEIRELPGYDPIRPKITLTGGAKVLLTVGQPYKEPGYQAADDLDGDITASVTVEGEVDRFTPGNYPILYSVKDSYGNLTTVVRSVEVIKIPGPQQIIPEGKVIYLTFDDGPGEYTPALLDILDKYNVKATFFVVDTGMPHVLKEITDRGHSIGIHTLTHDYQQIYSSADAFFEDLYGMQDVIFQATGVRTTLMRFPGGSSNTISIYNEGIMSLLTQAVQDAGFQYFDWNVDSNDAGGAKKPETVLTNMKAGILQTDLAVVLQHDIHDYSVEAVEPLILWALENGYTFLPLAPDSPECRHDVRN